MTLSTLNEQEPTVKSTGKSTKSRRAPRVSRLKSLDDVRSELARVYRLARCAYSDQIPVNDAKGLAYMLQVLSGVVKVADLEQRLDAMEQLLREVATREPKQAA